jgi:hypothetical protein
MLDNVPKPKMYTTRQWDDACHYHDSKVIKGFMARCRRLMDKGHN